ncbi:MAG: DUF6427 family protein [Bacteroidetes bacterium]|nr:DUF6427 family protein [Bacteroidota bacterium]
MFLKFFRSSFAAQYIMIALTGLILWGHTLISPVRMPVPSGPVPFYILLFQLLSDFPHIASLLGFLLVLGTAFFLNFLFTQQEIALKNSSLVAFLFLVFVSYFPFLLTLQPINISIFILLWILYQLFKTYNREESLELYFAAGFFVSIGSFFYFPFILFYLFILVSFIVFRSTIWREWLSSLIGLFTPYIFLITYYYVANKLPPEIKEYGHSISISNPFHMVNTPTVFLIFSALIILGLIIGFFYNMSHLTEKTIENRKKNILLYWSALFIVISSFFSKSLLNYHLQFLAPIVAAFLSYYLLHRKKIFWVELIYSLFLLAVILNNLIFG